MKLKRERCYEHIDPTFVVSSGDLTDHPNDSVQLGWHSDDPFITVGLFFSGPQAIAVGQALVRHGERLEGHDDGESVDALDGRP